MASTSTSTTSPPDTSAPPGRLRDLRTAAVAGIVANIAIIVTGSVVRITGSGLGCPDWPTCEGASVVPRAATAEWHTFIEFGNRLMTFAVLAVALWVLWLVRRQAAGPTPREATLRRLAWAQVAGVLAQAVLGGITVLTGLLPLVVAAHLLASMALVAVAVALHDRALVRPAPVVPALRPLSAVAVVAAGAVLVLGTLVTAAGPHSGGDPGTVRLGLDIRLLAVAHADAVWLLVGTTVACLIVARAHGAERAVRAAWLLLGLEVVQGSIGYAQYALGVPPAPVVVHVLGAALVWLAVWRLALAARPLVPRGADAVAPRSGA